MKDEQQSPPKKKRQPYRSHPKPEIGQRFGKLTLTDPFVGKDKGRNRLVRAMCDCGQETTVRYSQLTNGLTTSCGCVKLQRFNEYRARVADLIKFSVAVKIWDARGRNTLNLTTDELQSMHHEDILVQQHDLYARRNKSLLSVFAPELRHVKKVDRSMCLQEQIRRVQRRFEETTGYRDTTSALKVLQYELQGHAASFGFRIRPEHLSRASESERLQQELDELLSVNFTPYGTYRREVFNNDVVPEPVRLARAVLTMPWLRSCTGPNTRNLYRAAVAIVKIARETMKSREEYRRKRIHGEVKPPRKNDTSGTMMILSGSDREWSVYQLEQAIDAAKERQSAMQAAERYADRFHSEPKAYTSTTMTQELPF
jgi:hypothetical protein